MRAEAREKTEKESYGLEMKERETMKKNCRKREEGERSQENRDEIREATGLKKKLKREARGNFVKPSQ
jgi:hypothetical protein